MPRRLAHESTTRQSSIATVDDTKSYGDDDFLLDPNDSIEYNGHYRQSDQSASLPSSISSNRQSSVGRSSTIARNRSVSIDYSFVHYFRSAVAGDSDDVELGYNGSSLDAIASRSGTGRADSVWPTSNSSASSNDDVGAMIDVWTPDVVFRVATISLLIVLTLVGNALLIAVIVGQPSLRRKRVSVFLVNLAVGDLMVCFVTMTTEILFVAFGEWVLGAIACKLIVYGQIVTLASTTFILTAMSIDRYQASSRTS